MIKVGVIGYGNSSRTFHVPLIQCEDSFELTAIYSSQLETVKKALPEVKVFNDVDEFIHQSGIDLAIITSPNNVHFSQAYACLENNIHVVIEKPMVTHLKEAEILVELAKKQSRLLSVFQNRRWDGDFLTVKKIIAKGALGEVRFFESHFDRFRPDVQPRWREEPKPGSGIWFDLGPHLVDQAIVLFGMPKSLTARCLALREAAKTTDYFHVTLHYDSVEVILSASMLAGGENKRFNIQGTQANFVKYGLDTQEEHLKSGRTPMVKGFGHDHQDMFGMLYTRNESTTVETEIGCYQNYYLEIAEAIRTGQQCSISGQAVLNVMKILQLAELSNRDGLTISVH